MEKEKRKVVSIKKGKIIISSLLIGTMLFLFAGCGKKDDKHINSGTKKTVTSQTIEEVPANDFDNQKEEHKQYREIDLIANDIDENLTYSDIVNAISDVSDIVPYLNVLGVEKYYQDYVNARVQNDQKTINLAYSKLALAVLKAEVLSGCSYQDVKDGSVYVSEDFVINPEDVETIEIKQTINRGYDFMDADVDITFKSSEKKVAGGVSVVKTREPISYRIPDIGFCHKFNSGPSISKIYFSRKSTLFEQVMNIQNGIYYSIDEIDALVEQMFKTMLFNYSFDWDDRGVFMKTTQNIEATQRVLNLKK